VTVKLEELKRADRLESALLRLPTHKAERQVSLARQALAGAAEFDSLLRAARLSGTVPGWMAWEPAHLDTVRFEVESRRWQGIVPASAAARAPQSPFGEWQNSVLTELRRAGVAVTRARAVWCAFIEMCDNAVYHSGRGLESVFTFEISDEWFEFSVTDIGQGIANSLRTNPAYASLSDREAVMEAMKDGVTRIVDSLGGTGFTQLARAMAEFNCGVRIRTGELSLMWFGEGIGLTESSISPVPCRPGVHVRVVGDL
jgi:anti-sigma regulatory factor (Ser/Thr protein kinase)